MLCVTTLVSTKFLQALVGNNEAAADGIRKVNKNGSNGTPIDGDSERQRDRKETPSEAGAGLPGCRRSARRESKTRETG